MASISARLSVIGENGYGEQEQDANTALIDLDKGLRSSKIGEQCEAIVRFPRLFEKYPFPILINSSFLKLADVFRIGSNFLRMCILNVTQQTERHLDKIFNADEFVRRIYGVIHSNDPVARALTLRLLGSIACIISERKNVHHSIRVSFDSHDAVELEAAIYATERFALFSKTFASNIYNKIGDMIEGLATPMNVKLRLVPIFGNMYHDAETADKAVKLCRELLPRYPSREFILVILDTLSHLATQLLIYIPEQVSLLLEYLEKDPRQVVKVMCLKNLKLLASKGSHLWTEHHIQVVCQFVRNSPYQSLKLAGLDVLSALAERVAVAKFEIFPNSTVLLLCMECCYHENINIACKAIELMSHLAIHAHHEEEDYSCLEMNLFDEVTTAIETQLLACTEFPNDPQVNRAVKSCLKCAVKICEANPSISHQLASSLGNLVTSAPSGEIMLLISEALAALASQKSGILITLLPSLISQLQNMVTAPNYSQKLNPNVVMMCTLLLLVSKDRPSTPDIIGEIQVATNKLDLWSCYKIGRQAARYGHHLLATLIFSQLTNKVSLEHYHFWLTALLEICQAEARLQPPPSTSSLNPNLWAIADNVTQSITHYMKGISALKATITPNHPLTFQCEYIRLRAETLQAHAQLMRACTSLRTAPPPAIAASIASATRDDMVRCGRIAVQLRKCVKEFKILADQYSKLYQSVFDADPISLANIEILQHNSLIMVGAIECIIFKTNLSMFLGNEDDPSYDSQFSISNSNGIQNKVEIQGMLEASKEATSLIAQMSKQLEQTALGHHHIEYLLQISVLLMETPLCFPRYFFQTLQATSIKLAVSPQPRTPGEPVTIQNNSHLTVKVEGVIQHGSRPSLFRKIHAVAINISSAVQSRAQVNYDAKVSDSSTNNMSSTIEPHNDYFQAQFLLAFPVAGLHLVTIEASVVDGDRESWKTGPRSMLSVKSVGDETNQKGSGPGPSSAQRSTFPSRF